MRASDESGGNDLLQCSQVGRSSSITGLLRFGIVVRRFYVVESGGSMARWRCKAGGRSGCWGKWFLIPSSHLNLVLVNLV